MPRPSSRPNVRAPLSTSKRTPAQIFEHHGAALGADDRDGIVSDFSEDAVLAPQIFQRDKFQKRQNMAKVLTLSALAIALIACTDPVPPLRSPGGTQARNSSSGGLLPGEVGGCDGDTCGAGKVDVDE